MSGRAEVRAVTAFCSSAADVDRVYFEAAAEFGAAVARRGWTLVYGGNVTGPMGAMADAARGAGGRVVGVSPELFADVMDRRCDELIVTPDMRSRKAEMERRGDAFVTLPGGLGTLEEFFEIVVGRSLRTHGKPLVLLSANGFYDPLVEMMERGIADGFVREPAWRAVRVARTADEAASFLDEALG